MAKIEQQGTCFSLSLLPLDVLSKGFWAKIRLSVSNPFVQYDDINEDVSKEELENWIFAMFRLLAGGYGKEYNLSFTKAGIAIDFYPHTVNGLEVSREERRKHDCVMAIRLLMRDKKQFLGGVYTFLLHREEIERFAKSLREEFYETFSRFEKKQGEYLFVGVSPQGYTGCNYWYVDLKKQTNAGDYVWVVMGRHKTRQIVYVDSVRYCDAQTAPYDTTNIRAIERIATAEEIAEWKKTFM